MYNETFRYIHVNCSNRLRFLAEVSTILQKYTFLDNLRTTTQEGNMETRQMTPFFSSYFSNLTVIFISEFENTQNSFWCGPPFGPLWSVKYSIFGQKLLIPTAHHTFLQSKHTDVTKNLYYVLSTHRSQIPIFLGSKLMDYNIFSLLTFIFNLFSQKYICSCTFN